MIIMFGNFVFCRLRAAAAIQLQDFEGGSYPHFWIPARLPTTATGESPSDLEWVTDCRSRRDCGVSTSVYGRYPLFAVPAQIPTLPLAVGQHGETRLDSGERAIRPFVGVSVTERRGPTDCLLFDQQDHSAFNLLK
jgi:hypothetical protein